MVCFISDLIANNISTEKIRLTSVDR